MTRFLKPPRSAIADDLRIDEQQAISHSLEPAADRGEIVGADSHHIETASAYDRGYVVSGNCTVDTSKPSGPEVKHRYTSADRARRPDHEPARGPTWPS